MKIALIVAAITSIFAITETHAIDLPSCPGLKANGSPVALIYPGITSVTSEASDNAIVPAMYLTTPISVIGYFEAGQNNPYTNISNHDGISIGFLQWNHDTGSLYDTFLTKVSDRLVANSSLTIKSDLEVLKNYSKHRNKKAKQQASRVISSWNKKKLGDPLVNGIRKSVREGLTQWLGRNELRSIQNELAEIRLRKAYSWARKWLSDQGLKNPTKSEMNVTITSFYDVLVYNDGRKKMWLPHAKKFRENFKTTKAMFHHVSNWLLKCQQTQVSGFKHTKMYSRDEAVSAANNWLKSISADSKLYSENQLNLFALGYQIAIRSYGNNGGEGFRGIYQADVMLRRGAIVLKTGTVHGVSISSIWPAED